MMELTPEERRRIYEEEKARIAAQDNAQTVQEPQFGSRKKLFIIAIVITLIVAGVIITVVLFTGSPISTSELRAEFEKSHVWENALSKQWIRIRRFDKGDGQMSERSGVKIYTVSYSAWAEYLQPVDVVRSKPRFSTSVSIEPVLNMGQAGEYSNIKGNSFTDVEQRQPKDEELILGEAVYTLYDSGWKLQSIKTTNCTHLPIGGRK